MYIFYVTCPYEKIGITQSKILFGLKNRKSQVATYVYIWQILINRRLIIFQFLRKILESSILCIIVHVTTRKIMKTVLGDKLEIVLICSQCRSLSSKLEQSQNNRKFIKIAETLKNLLLVTLCIIIIGILLF